MHPHRFHIGSASEGSYATRIMGSLVASLAFMILLAHLPIVHPQTPIGWEGFTGRDDVLLQSTPPEHRATAAFGVPVTTFADTEPIPDEGPDEETAEEIPVSTPTEAPPKQYAVADLQKLTVTSEQGTPRVVGGLGAFYINIEYPEEARREGIEGLLRLSFFVEPDGTPTNISVEQSLHPACDSAAVQALRATRFVPGRQNGIEVRVRMTLPIRFDLLNQESAQERAAARTSNG